MFEMKSERLKLPNRSVYHVNSQMNLCDRGHGIYMAYTRTLDNRACIKRALWQI